MMKYLAYARHNGEQGAECRCGYGNYEIVEGDSISDAIFEWWNITTDKAKEVWDYNKDVWEIELGEQPYEYYYIKDRKFGWFIHNIIVIPLFSRGVDDDQPLDKLNVNK